MSGFYPLQCARGFRFALQPLFPFTLFSQVTLRNIIETNPFHIIEN